MDTGISTLPKLSLGSDGKIRGNMTVSGTNIGELIEEIEAADKLKYVKPYEDKITLTNKKLEQFGVLNTLANDFQKITNSLKGQGTEYNYDGAFSGAVAILLDPTGKTDSGYASVSVVGSVREQTLRFSIDQVADYDSFIGSDILIKDWAKASTGMSNPNTALGWTGNLTVGTAGGSSTSITVLATWSLTDLMNNINLQNGTTGVTASMTTSNGQSFLKVQADTAGQVLTFDTSGMDLGGSDPNFLPATSTDTVPNRLALLSAKNQPLGWFGNLVLGVQDSTTQTITIAIDESWTLERLVNEINSKDSMSRVNASIRPSGSNGYKLQIQAKDIATPISINATGVSGDMAAQVPTSSNTSTLTRIQNLSAKITYATSSGDVSAYFATNTIDSLIPGILIEAVQVTPQTQFFPAHDKMTLKLEGNATQVAEEFTQFVKKYNELIDLYNEQGKRIESDDEENKDKKGLLSNSLFLRELISNLRTNAYIPTPGLNNSVSIKGLADMGVSIDTTTSKMVLDPSALLSAIAGNYEDVKTALGFTYTQTNSDFTIVRRPTLWVNQTQRDSNGNPVKDVTAQLTKNTGGGYSGSFTVNGRDYPATATLKGDYIYIEADPNIDSPVRGLSISYSYANIGTGETKQTTITGTQGVMDRLNETLKTYFNSQTGLYKTEKESIDVDLERYRTRRQQGEQFVKRKIESESGKFQLLQKVLAELENSMRFMNMAMANMWGHNK